jgi:AbiV family abortive infection protein
LIEQEAFLRKVALESLKNAERYIKDAKILLKNKSFGHAFAMAVLGEEESSKAFMFQHASEGIAGIDGKWREEVVKYHTVKQRLAFGTALVYEIFLIAMKASDYAKKRAKGDGNRFKELFDRKYAELMQKEQKMASQARGDFYEHLIPFNQLQRDREKAMYVEANLIERRISSPKHFKKAIAENYIFDVDERLDVLRQSIGRKWTGSEKENAISFRRYVMNQLGEKQKKKQLEWYGITEKDL